MYISIIIISESIISFYNYFITYSCDAYNKHLIIIATGGHGCPYISLLL